MASDRLNRNVTVEYERRIFLTLSCLISLHTFDCSDHSEENRKLCDLSKLFFQNDLTKKIDLEKVYPKDFGTITPRSDFLHDLSHER
ncbi:CLUMA_CG008512, isoform A [Clunio marinus]|uniref:CLUMA_CG008512, isoform A n=1 Tax=Clunio marinus TaxID=568069 RepID=A0A1J1I5L1_9DIPT|nr:CLUMA_CG008512, isoform A [Clunio marinus]